MQTNPRRTMSQRTRGCLRSVTVNETRQQDKNTLPSEADSSLFYISLLLLICCTHNNTYMHAHDAHARPVTVPQHEHRACGGFQCRYIQVVPGGMDKTSGECSLC